MVSFHPAQICHYRSRRCCILQRARGSQSTCRKRRISRVNSILERSRIVASFRSHVLSNRCFTLLRISKSVSSRGHEVCTRRVDNDQLRGESRDEINRRWPGITVLTSLHWQLVHEYPRSNCKQRLIG